MAKRTRKAARQPSPDRRQFRTAAASIFVAALASRLLFWLATPDRRWGWSAYFKGDAPLWLEYARAIQTSQPFELGLPIHPPGAAWLVALLWNGSESGIVWLRLWWLVLGALVPLLVFIAAERSFGMRVAAIAGGACAISTGLMLLSTSINNETPYLVLAVGSMCFVKSLPERPAAGGVVAWSGLNSIACLFRVEHLLFFLPAFTFFSIGWIRSRNPAAPKWLITALIAFALPLVPWHLSAWSAVRDFNEKPRALVPMEERAVRGVEEGLIGVRWTPEAQRRRDELPAFLRRTIGAFLLATVDHRGGREVRSQDFDILDEAFGYVPRPLGRFLFVSSYGPLNFSLANHGGATGGFDRSLLEAQPPLSGGAAQYPPFMVQGLPPPQLSFVYPPHLRLFNDGYAIGWKWIAGHPRQFAALALRKLSIFWSGAALGVTGCNLPLGLSGTRRSVDLVVPAQGWTTGAWGAGLLALAAIGVAAGWHKPDLWPWLLLIASKVAVAILFFGYARLGATIIPGIAILAALAVSRRFGRWSAALVAMLVLGVSVEAARYLAGPALRLDDQPVGMADPYPRDFHRDQRLDVSK